MKIVILAPALALAALSVSGCGPKADTGATNAAATETLTLNEEGDAALANSDGFEANATDPAPDNAIGDNALAPAAGNAL
ncbi:hypothetical protein LPN01_13755 [Sphingomonas sp. A2-49]|uniref:hypothetical protein n=1 Tax=Sphingomonas sp. A2-49 TaxID=1391375 RepID=UPI0021D2765D|nr:hypothetical protein [Sphingomonas sp. A2-49]MCU6455145.1 hypothetical protein [Sphingomonas sp. A2-49]